MFLNTTPIIHILPSVIEFVYVILYITSHSLTIILYIVSHLCTFYFFLTLKMFSCTVCDQVFSSKDNVRRHIKTHNENRTRYSCNLCTRTFTHKGDLYRHEKIFIRSLTNYLIYVITLMI